MQSKEFFEALRALEEEKNIKQELFIEALESGLTSAYKKIYGEAKKAKVKLVPERNMIKIYSYKTVVDVVEDPEKEISLQEAKLIKKSYKVGDEVLQEENSKDFGRVPSSTVKHVILQKIRELTRKQDHEALASKEGQIVSLQLMRYESGTKNFYFNMGGKEVECVMSDREIIPGETFKPQSMVKLYVKKILENPRGVQMIVSRRHPLFVQRLLEAEIPELANGEIYVQAISREAGVRTKVAVHSKYDVDVVGACVGLRSTRLMPVLKELHGEKIDIIPYSEDIEKYISNALSPATTEHLELDMENKSALVVVPDDKLSLAIGKDGHNVRLASKLTGWKLDVKSVTEFNEENNLDFDLDTSIYDTSNYVTDDEDDVFGDIEE